LAHKIKQEIIKNYPLLLMRKGMQKTKKDKYFRSMSIFATCFVAFFNALPLFGLEKLLRRLL